MKFKISLLTLLLSPLLVHSQIEYLNRLEIDLKDDREVSEINPMGKNGMLLLLKDENSKKGERDWYYDFYSNSLQIEDQKEVALDKKMVLEGTIESNESIISFYKRSGRGDFEIITFLSENDEIIKTKGELPKKMSVRGIYQLDDVIFATGMIKKEPVIWRINWRTGIKKVLPLSVPNYKLKNLKILELQTLGVSKELFVFVQAFGKRNAVETYVIKYDAEGVKQDFHLIKTDEEHSIRSSSTSRIDADEYIVNGTYSTPKSAGSNGLFIAKIRDKKLDFIKYYNFLDLNDFLSYLPEKKQERIEKKRRKKRKKGKEYNISYNIMAHDVVKNEDGYIFIGEAYYATYRQVANTTYVNGQARTTYTQVFDGYRYTHAVIAKFSNSGELIWDRTFDLDPGFKPFVRKKFISVSNSDRANLKMVYGSRNKLVVKAIELKSGEVIVDKESSEIELYSEDDRAKSKRSMSSVMHWYDDYFIAYGTQKIKNKEDGKRNVFFLSKIRFDENASNE